MHHDPPSAPGATADRHLLSGHSVLSLLTSASEHLRSQGFDEARLHVELMLARVLACKRLDLYLQFDRPLTHQEVAIFKQRYRRRLDHEPLQYILGDTEFMGRTFAVDRRALIPRPETELLVGRAVELLGGPSGHAPACDPAPDAVHVLDIGTGCGNIALSVALMVPRVRMTAVDVSPAALELAAENAARLLPGRVEFLPGDVRGELLPGRTFHLILANPPYIPLAEYRELQPEVRDWEPALALTDEADGMLVPSRVLTFAAGRLEPGGTLLMEIGAGQCGLVLERAAAAGLAGAKVHPDHAGIPRLLEARRPGGERV